MSNIFEETAVYDSQAIDNECYVYDTNNNLHNISKQKPVIKNPKIYFSDFI